MDFLTGYLLGRNGGKKDGISIIGLLFILYVVYKISETLKYKIVYFFNPFILEVIAILVLSIILSCRYRRSVVSTASFLKILMYFVLRLISYVSSVIVSILLFNNLNWTIFSKTMDALGTKEWDISWFVLTPLDYFCRICFFTIILYAFYKIHDYYQETALTDQIKRKDSSS